MNLFLILFHKVKIKISNETLFKIFNEIFECLDFEDSF